MNKISLVLTVLLLSACSTRQYTHRVAARYNKAIHDAMYPQAHRIAPLISASSENSKCIHKKIQGEDHILMLTWKSQNFYPDSGMYNTGKWEIWVSAAPELLQKMNRIKPKYREARLKQLLGLPPTATYHYFIEMWVKPGDLIRPCPDKDAGDTYCNIGFTSQDSLDKEHLRWINQGRIDRYYANDLYQRYPWTQLGYTYDWNPRNKSHVGVSEFVIPPHTTVYIQKAYTTQHYLDTGGYAASYSH